MRTPPPADLHVSTQGPAVPGRDVRFLFFVGMVLVALALGFKSELFTSGQVWVLGAVLLVVACPALAGYLRGEGVMMPPVEHFIPVVLGTVAIAGLALMAIDWWKFALAVALFGTGFVAAGWLDRRRLRKREKPGHMVLQETVMILALAAAFLVVLTVNLPLPVRMGWVFALSTLATYRSFRALGRQMAPRRAFLFSLVVGQLVMFFAFAITVYLDYQEGAFAAILVFLWYVNRGIIRHTVEETLTRNVVVEYGLFILLLAYLFFISYTPHS